MVIRLNWNLNDGNLNRGGRGTGESLSHACITSEARGPALKLSELLALFVGHFALWIMTLQISF